MVNIESGLSDPHRGRRGVMALTFEDGVKVMYKPREVSTEAAFVRLLDWCNAHDAPLRFKSHRILARTGYGWAEHVAHEPCPPHQVLRFYKRAGMLLCVLYVVGATDCHAENIVASDEYPVLIDMETIMQPDPPSLGGDSFTFDSVLRTGLLPRLECHRGTSYLADVSGLGIETPPRNFPPPMAMGQYRFHASGLGPRRQIAIRT